MMKPHPPAIPVMLMIFLWSLPAAATTVLPVPLPQMTAAADSIFHGRTISNTVKRDPASGQVATFTQFEVIEVIKGKTGNTHTIKQIGGQLPGGGARLAVHGVPIFTVDHEYVVFLPKPSSLGFASPIGLSQGKFDTRKLNGQTVVSNGRPLDSRSKARSEKTSPNTPTAILTEPSAALNTVPGQPASAYLTDFLHSVRGLVKE
jgi:hypothetical protein